MPGKNVLISNPYIGDGKKQEQTGIFASTRVGDKMVTFPFIDTSEKEYISTKEYEIVN